jgi:flagellar basal-body rod protein FlgG
MIKGLYSAFTALEAAWQYQDVLANNVANATTIGYKRELGVQQSFSDVLLSQQAPTPAPLSARIEAVVGQIGTGTFIAEFSTDYAPGSLQATGQELDLALTDGFFAVRDEQGQVFYTRDGRFSRDANGDLVASHGLFVLDQAGDPIRIPDGATSVDVDGVISTGEAEVARLQVIDFTPGSLTRAGEAYFTSDTPGTLVQGGIRQGYLESSNTDMVEELTTLLAVQRRRSWDPLGECDDDDPFSGRERTPALQQDARCRGQQHREHQHRRLQARARAWRRHSRPAGTWRRPSWCRPDHARPSFRHRRCPRHRGAPPLRHTG